ncbi:Dna2/Cas4 domain-containing protein [Candidatus Chlorohelix sp.]|uniref:CRISPR-associated protein Cas4 n=1 Tax=Candidatus Chlorohelix sp. TaxID=3139201 RepID=UPI0030489F2E
MVWLITIAFILIVFGFLFTLWSKKAANSSGLPFQYRIVYSDTGGWKQVEKSLYSARYNLIGKPDYIVKTRTGLIPVEVKPKRIAPQPYYSDILQLAAYCLLLEEDWQEKPAYGILRYAEQTFRIEWNSTLRTELLEIISEMRDLEKYAATPGCKLPEPNHDMTKRCLNCGYYQSCHK